MESSKIDSGIGVFIPENSKCFLTLKFSEDEINQIQSGEQLLWVEILNRSCEVPIEMKKDCVLGFFYARNKKKKL